MVVSSPWPLSSRSLAVLGGISVFFVAMNVSSSSLQSTTTVTGSSLTCFIWIVWRFVLCRVHSVLLSPLYFSIVSACTGGGLLVIACCVVLTVLDSSTVSPGVIRLVLTCRSHLQAPSFCVSLVYHSFSACVIVFASLINPHFALEESRGWRSTRWWMWGRPIAPEARIQDTDRVSTIYLRWVLILSPSRDFRTVLPRRSFVE